ncbi:HAD family hydrolase [Algoriphagus formosus]|uniref:phosphoserine phosphatase n=1 Tax=Algoriphagus formosus TaxID=2007308 RepID=A0A4R5V104_9BACT|nr:HAD family hydrolase [Algoriphagus aquimaris]TDK45422.1 haloacid dehalogenase-like hydrolase [Algoriphagus aquimaris]
MKKYLLVFLISFLTFACSQTPQNNQSSLTKAEPFLESWNEGVSKKAIEDFIKNTTDPNSPDFIPEKDRIAVFDNDGTLWAEQPMYFQLYYAIDFIKKNASDHPEWSKIESIQAILQDDLKAALDGGTQAILELVMVSHSDMTAEEFAQSVRSWLQESRHPQTGKPYNQMIYQPMVELLELLRANDYKTFIVSGGGIDFLRVWAEEAYGIPPYQVVGTSLKAKYEEQNGKMEIIKIPELNFIDDKEGKPVGIHQHIGMKPIIAGGNSDGDYQMIEYTTQGSGPSLGIYIHHTDSIREYAYDRESHVGRLDKGLDDAARLGWLVVDMAKDWKTIYPE